MTTAAAFDCRRDDRGWHYKRGERRVTCRPARPSQGAARLWGGDAKGPGVAGGINATAAGPRLGKRGTAKLNIVGFAVPHMAAMNATLMKAISESNQANHEPNVLKQTQSLGPCTRLDANSASVSGA